MSKKMKNNFWKEQEREYEAIKSKVSELIRVLLAVVNNCFNLVETLVAVSSNIVW